MTNDPQSDNIVPIAEAFDKAKRPRGKKPEPIAADHETWPVTALGVRGDLYYFLDAMGQLRAMKASEFGRLGLMGLWGHKNHILETVWPRYGRGGAVTGAEYNNAASAHISAAASKGVWDVFGRTRGSGAWADEDGRLILHCGNAVWSGEKWNDPGLLGGYVYPADKTFLRPWESKVSGGTKGPAQALLEIISTWNWKRGEFDARLLLGWIGAAMLGGAIQWRPVVYITGGRGTGKSTLQRLLSLIFDGALIAVSDSSAAGIWQKLGHSTLPVTLDEVEAEEDGRRGQSLLKLARQAASGGIVLRGGSDHGASEFTVRSCFLFSSILIPPLQPQDRSRIAVLELGELAHRAELDLDAKRMRELGRRLMRRLVDGWGRWDDTREQYCTALAAVGHSARGADVFGTLLAAADLLLDDAPPHSDIVEEIAKQFDVTTLAEAENDVREEEQCLQYLLTKSIPLDGAGERRSVGEWVRRAAGISPIGVDSIEAKDIAIGAQQMLCRHGCKVVEEGVDQYLAVASGHALLQTLFSGTHWAGRSGSVGVWTQALRRLPGARPSGKSVWFCGPSGKATFIPLANVLSDPDAADIKAAGAGYSTLWSREQ